MESRANKSHDPVGGQADFPSLGPYGAKSRNRWSPDQRFFVCRSPEAGLRTFPNTFEIDYTRS